VRTTTKLRSCGSLMLLFAAACGLPDPETTSAPEQDQAPAGATPQIAQTREVWRKAMRDLKLPTRGCFTSDFPGIAWKQVACGTPPNIPYPPHQGRRSPQTVGGGTDWAARVNTGLILRAEGAFDTVSGVTSIDSTASGGVSEFSLQLNTQFFTTPACAGASNPAICQGWEQFVFSNTGSGFIQYWMLPYDNPCPAGWISYATATGNFCYKNGAGSISPGHQNVSDLASLRLEGAADLGGDDTITMTTPGGTLFATNNDSELTLAGAWRDAEFNIVGDAYGSEAAFNAGSTVTVHTTVHNGTRDAPTCVLEGFTAETNSLTLVGTPAIVGLLPAPGIVFNQTNVTPFSASSCASAMGTGDPHMYTVLGTGYDFMGIGDYLWAQRGANFVVQTRQISGAPSWPNAAVNKEVATRMGKSRIAVCSLERLEINGKATSLGDGKQINLPDATIERHGNVFLITGQSGDSVRAVVNSASPNYIDVHVGFGQWPDTVLGLLGNGKSANELVARDGTVLTAPVSFQDLYSKFGDSWRVAPKDSLLCSNEQVERRNPDKPFCVKDLDPKTREHAQAVCAQFGIKQGPLLDACILDVAMLGDGAARAFVNAPPPVVVGDAACR